jgi:hypothetical protein
VATVRFVMRRNAPREIRRSREVLRELERRARNIADAAGPGHEVDSEVNANRARASVRTTTIDAMIAEATSRNLTRAIDAGR